MKSIPYGRQSIDRADVREVVKVLRSDWLSQGPKICEFEEAIAAYCGAKYAVAVSSGTAALHLACLTAGLTPGTEAVTTPMTFLATANAVAFTGAKPVFADIDGETVNIDPAAIAKQITSKTKAILPVHFAGFPAAMQEIDAMASRLGIPVIEDGCHALGAEYRGHKIGSCQYSAMTVFSFHPVKQITMGEGGCILTNQKKIYQRLLTLRNHGMVRSEKMKAKYGAWYFEMRELGFNYRITDIQCALGISQLRKSDGFLERRTRIAQVYQKAFASLKSYVRLPVHDDSLRRHAWHLYLLRVKQESSPVKRRELYEALRAQGINAHVHYTPLYRHPYYRNKLRLDPHDFPNTERYYREALSLPIYPELTGRELKQICNAVKEVFEPQGVLV